MVKWWVSMVCNLTHNIRDPIFGGEMHAWLYIVPRKPDLTPAEVWLLITSGPSVYYLGYHQFLLINHLQMILWYPFLVVVLLTTHLKGQSWSQLPMLEMLRQSLTLMMISLNWIFLMISHHTTIDDDYYDNSNTVQGISLGKAMYTTAGIIILV